MTQSVFDRETLLDLTVNAIPLAIILFFIVVFAVMNPFGPATVVQAVQFSILGVMFVALALLTYYSGKAVASAEQKTEESEEELVQEAIGSTEAVSDVDEPDVADAQERVVHEEGSEPFEGEPDVEPGERTDEK